MTHQLENGFTKIADTLLEALPLAGLSKREMQVVLVIIRRAYGFNSKDALLSYSFLEAATGISRRHCIATVNALVEKGAIRRHSSHRGSVLSIVKEWFEVVPKIGTIPSAQNRHPRVVPKIGTEVVPKTVHAVVPKTAPNKEISTKTSKDTIDQFDHFWHGYPRKVAKAKAAKAWNNLKQADRTAALAALPHWPFSPDANFQPHATTWLNQRRWEDEPDTAPTTTRSNGNGNYRQQQHDFLERQAALAGLGLGATATDDGLVVDMDGGLVRRRLLGQDGA